MMERKVIFTAGDSMIGYPGRVLCSGISFNVLEGDTILLCGANGSGKSTLLRAIAGGSVGSGSVRKVMVPTGIPKVKGFTLREFIQTSLYRESSWNGIVGKELQKSIDRSLELMGLEALASRDISTLSDGEFQKGTVAAALCRVGGGSGLILLDEPTAFLDPENKILVFRALRKVAEETGTAFVYSTHDISAALGTSTAVWALSRSGEFLSGRETKTEVISSIFSDKSVIFGFSAE